MTPEKKSRLKLFAKIAVTVVFLTVTLCLVKLDVLGDRLRHADIGPLAVAAFIFALSGFAGAASWFCVLRTRLPEISYRETAACHWSGMFFNSFLPTNVGGDVVKGYMMAHGHGQVGFVVTSLLLDRTLNLGLLVAIGLFALLLRLGQLGWAIVFLVSLGLLFLIASVCAKRLVKWIHRWPRSGVRGRLAALLEPVFELMSLPRRFAPMLAAAGVSQLLKTWQNVFLIQALSLDIPALCVWYVIPLFGVVSALPISIGGLGVREVVAHHLAAPLGMDNTHLVAFSLASQFIVTVVDMLGVLPFLFANRHRNGKKNA
jgi:uncharacterized protein (TIRG00374 family)